MLSLCSSPDMNQLSHSECSVIFIIQLKAILRVHIYFSPNCQTAYPETLRYAPLVVLMLRGK